MRDLKSVCNEAGISRQTFYNLVKQDAEFAGIVDANKEKAGNAYVYGDAVTEYITSKYGIKTRVQTPETPLESREQCDSTNIRAEQTSAAGGHTSAISTDAERLKNALELAQKTIDELRERLEQSEIDRREVQTQNSQLLLLLQQEKQEKQLYLPKPRRPFVEALREKFKR